MANRPVKERRDFQGIPIALEFHAGDFKEDKDNVIPGMGWHMYADYGYIEDTVSMESGDALDVFVGPNSNEEDVYVVSLLDPDGIGFSEDKVCLGYDDIVDVQKLMDFQYNRPTGPIYCMTIDDLKQCMADGRLMYEKGEGPSDEQEDGDLEDAPESEEFQGPGEVDGVKATIG